MPAPSPDSRHHGGDSPNVVSPFAEAAATMPPRRSGGNKLILQIVAAALLLIGGIAGGIFLAGRLNDPLRTLEKFPVAKYLDGHRAITGLRFRGELRVEADLGWKEGIGRLMVFAAQDDARPIAVMIPPHLAGTYFTKGQSYTAELEVKEGGLIYANSCRKN